MEKISVKEFVEKYNKRNSKEGKEGLVKSVMNNRYVSFTEKVAMLNMGLEKSVVTDPAGFRYIDILSQKLNFYAMLLAMYTNLQISESDGSFINVYDSLKESKVLDILISYIEQDEFKECVSINGNLIDIFMSKNNTNAAVVNQVVFSFSKKMAGLISAGLTKVERVLNDKGFINNIVDRMSAVLK